MTESNLARSLFSGKSKTPSRKKLGKGFSAAPEEVIPSIFVDVVTTNTPYKDNLGKDDLGKQDLEPQSTENSEAQPEPVRSEIEARRSQDESNSQVIQQLRSEISQLHTENQVQAKKLAQLHQQNQELEIRLKSNLSASHLLQRSLQEMEGQYHDPQVRIQSMEAQIAELQEQVLKQAGQAAEYEAAIQHWKEQSLYHQRHSLQLSGALERLMDEQSLAKRTTKLERELLKTMEKPEELVASTSIPASSVPEEPKPNGKVNLPAFLIRTRPAVNG